MKYFVIAFLVGMFSACAGKDGNDGASGSSCRVVEVSPGAGAPNGGGRIECSDGTQTTVLNGAPGKDGQDGTQVRIVELCPAVTVYPNTFTEVAFCIDGNLYAVYSANGGFESEIPPGTYNSNGINSFCTFTVGPNCQISH